MKRSLLVAFVFSAFAYNSHAEYVGSLRVSIATTSKKPLSPQLKECAQAQLELVRLAVGRIKKSNADVSADRIDILVYDSGNHSTQGAEWPDEYSSADSKTVTLRVEPNWKMGPLSLKPLNSPTKLPCEIVSTGDIVKALKDHEKEYRERSWRNGPDGVLKGNGMTNRQREEYEATNPHY